MQQGARGTSGTILIVDEDGGSVRELQARLERRGFSTVVAPSRPEALSALVRCRPDLIAVDLDGSRLGGREIISTVRADIGQRHLPIIALSAERTSLGLPSGADDLIKKPVDPDEFAGRAEVWLRIGQLRQEGLAKSRALAALSSVAAALSRSLSLREVLEQALHQILDLMGMETGVVFLASGGGHGLHVSAGKGMVAAELDPARSMQLSEAFARAVAEASRPILISDFADSAGVIAGIEAIPGVRSAAGLPLVCKDRVVGTISMFARHPRLFSQEEERLLTGLGQQLGVAIENARLFDETAGALARSNLLYELSNQLHSIQNFEDALRLAAREILEAFQADGTLISLQETEGGEVTRMGIFLDGRQGSDRSSALDPVAQAVMDAGKPVLITRAGDSPADLPAPLLEEGVQALLAVPVQGISGRHGSLALYYRRPREFRPLDVETLVVYANHLGIAMENARLYAAAKQRAERIAALNRLTRVISSSLDINSVYQAFAEEVRLLIPYDRMGIVVPDDSGSGLQMFQFAAQGPTRERQGSVWSNSEGTGIAWVMSSRQPHIEPDLAQERLFVEDELLLEEGIRSSVRLPLVARGKVVGALFLDSAVPHRYAEGDLEMLVPVGEQLAIAVENSRLFQEINRLAITDELTGLFNRRHFYHHLEQEFRRARRYNRPLSLIMVDIDGFKGFNDLQGHLAGDQILRMLAGRLRSSTRAVDLLARYGGDEFSIILPETDLKQAMVQAERIRSAVERDSQGVGGQAEANNLTASLGIACLGSEIHRVEDLILAADQALYRSKAAGGNRISLA